MRRTKFGLNLVQSIGKDALYQVALADRLRFDSVWAFERHGQPGGPASPMLYLAAAGANSRNLALGADIAILPLYNPVRLAEEVSLLDNLTGGRVILGVGAGYRREEFLAYGVPFGCRGKITDEALPLLVRLLEGQRVTHRGEFFNVQGFRVYPLPVQKPRPPIWVGGWVGAALKRAAKLADAWLPGPAASLMDVSKAAARYRKYIDKEPKDRPIVRDICIGTDSASALALARDRVKIYREYASHSHPLGSTPGFSHDLGKVIHGDPNECIKQIEEVVNLGFNHIILRVHHEGMSHEAVVNCMTLLADHVLPRFK